VRRNLIAEIKKSHQFKNAVLATFSLRHTRHTLAEEIRGLRQEIELMNSQYEAVAAQRKQEIHQLRQEASKYERFYSCKCDKDAVLRSLQQGGDAPRPQCECRKTMGLIVEQYR